MPEVAEAPAAETTDERTDAVEAAPEALVETDLLVESDLLVEDVSIDGMCGVY